MHTMPSFTLFEAILNVVASNNAKILTTQEPCSRQAPSQFGVNCNSDHLERNQSSSSRCGQGVYDDLVRPRGWPLRNTSEVILTV